MKRDGIARFPGRWLDGPAMAARHLHGWLRARPAGMLALTCAFLAIGGCSTDRYLSFLDPQGPVAAAQRTHFFWVLGILVIFVALPIFAFLPWVLWRYRDTATSSLYSPRWKSSLPIEIMMWAGPVVIVIVLSFMVWHYTHDLDPYRPVASAKPALRVQAIGYNWKWLFVYPDQGIATVGVMAIPVDKPVAMQLTSATVMQSLHIPALVSQIYAMGGMITQLHFKADSPGRSLGMNNMYNGKGFTKQRFTVVAMPRDEFEAWVERVRTNGMPMETTAYDALDRFNTLSELTMLLPHASHDGHLFFTQVSKDLFPSVVGAIKSDSPLELNRVLKTSSGGLPARSDKDASLQEHTP